MKLTVHDAAGGYDGLLRLASAWHARVLEDEVVSHAFSHGYHRKPVIRQWSSSSTVPSASARPRSRAC